MLVFKTTNVSSHDNKIIPSKLVKPLPKGTKFCIQTTKIPDLSVLPTVYESDGKSKIFNVHVYNETNKDLLISNRRKPFDAEIIHHNNDDIERLDSSSTVENSKVKGKQDLLNFIKNDKAMDKNEIDQERDQLKQKGYIQPSVTQYIEDKSSVTELGLVDDRPLSDKEFLELFDIKHLSKKSQDQA